MPTDKQLPTHGHEAPNRVWGIPPLATVRTAKPAFYEELVDEFVNRVLVVPHRYSPST
jgi:hypothetical protein